MVEIFKSLGKPFLLFDSDIADHLSRYLPGSRKWLHEAVRRFVHGTAGDGDLYIDGTSTQLHQLSIAGGVGMGESNKNIKASKVFWLCADAGQFLQ